MEKQFNVMLARKGSIEKLDSGMWAQYKFDGTRCLIFKTGDNVIMTGRSWKKEYQEKYPEIVADIQKLPYDSLILDGELTFVDDKGMDKFLTALTSKETYEEKKLKPKYNVFDVLKINECLTDSLPLRMRYALMLKIIPDIYQHLELPGYVLENQKNFFADIMKMGAEGIILKNPDSPYHFGRDKNWLKIKKLYEDNADTVDAHILGYCYGTVGGRLEHTIGAIIVAEKLMNGKGVPYWHYIAKATGMTDLERAEIKARLDELQIDIPHKMFNHDQTKSKRKVDVWIKPSLIAEIRYQDRTEAQKLRFPTFLRIRDDL